MAETDPARVVAGADVLAADLLVGDEARHALDHVRKHSWMVLVASDQLLADAETVIAAIAGETLAGAYRERVEREGHRVEHDPGDNPALASAIAGDAAHVLTFDEALTSPETGLALGQHAISVRTPAAFAQIFDPGALHETVVGGHYPGPDQDPRN